MYIMEESERQRDKRITREIHKLFWKGNLADPSGLIICYLTRFPAMILNNVFIPLVIAYGIEAIVSRNFDQVNHYAIVLVALGVAWCILWAIGGLTICRNALVGCEYVQRKVFANYMQKDYEFYSNTYLGALGAQATRLREAFNEYNSLVVLNGPRQLIIVLSGIIVIGFQSLTLALITLACMGSVLSYTILSSRWRLKFRRQLSVANSELAGVVGDALGQGATVKSFAAEQYEEELMHTAFKPWGRAQYKSWVASIPADTGRTFLVSVTMAILLVFTANLYRDNSISIAMVALVQLYVIKMIAATHDIAEIIKTYEVTMGGAYHAVKTMLIEPEVKDPAKPVSLGKNAKLDIKFAKTGFAYEDAGAGNVAVANFDLAIAPGEKIGLIGYSGSGKTTLTKLLLRFMDAAQGSISIAGVDIRNLKQQELRRRIAYVPQEPMLFHRTVLENITYGNPSADKQAVIKAAKAAYVDEFAEKLPHGYDTIVGERGVKLSGGQRQRVAIARALLKDAPILVLDEATSALDSRSEQLIQKALWKLMKDRTALVIAHRLSTIQRMDRIAVMDKGAIVQLGTHEELLKDKTGIYAELWTHQSGGYVGVPDKDELADGIAV